MSSSHVPMISVILPVYCEVNTIESCVAQIVVQFQQIGIEAYEIIMIDDGSHDESWSILEQLCDADRRFSALRFARNFGKEGAILAGLVQSSGEAAIVMDSDGQHPPSLLPEMIELWRCGDFDVVNAVKNKRGRETAWSKFTAKNFYRVYGWLTGVQMHGASDFKLLDRKVIDHYCRLEERNLFFRGIIGWLGYRQTHLGFDVEDRIGGTSSWGTLQRVRLAFDAISSFSSLPLQIVTFLGLLFLVSSTILGVQTFFTWLSGEAVAGFSTVILLLLITGAAIMLSLGIIGQYLAKIYSEIKARPRYVLSEQLPSKYMRKTIYPLRQKQNNDRDQQQSQYESSKPSQMRSK